MKLKKIYLKCIKKKLHMSFKKQYISCTELFKNGFYVSGATFQALQNGYDSNN